MDPKNRKKNIKRTWIGNLLKKMTTKNKSLAFQRENSPSSTVTLDTNSKEIKSIRFINKRNISVRTVEEVLEKVLYDLNYISECNYGVLQKVGWSRASRTDKKVSAIFNMVSAKLHKFDTDEEMKEKINKLLPEDVKIFKVIEVSQSFDAKDSNNNREYHYILPSFCLKPKSLETNSIEKVSFDNYLGDYSFKITPEYREKIDNICKYYKGSKKYHNYTKKMSFKDDSSTRHIYELSLNEIIEYEGFQAVKFKIIGQSFLYNQIRKMIGFIIQVCRDGLETSVIENSFYANKMDIPKAPAEGLYLYKVRVD